MGELAFILVLIPMIAACREKFLILFTLIVCVIEEILQIVEPHSV